MHRVPDERPTSNGTLTRMRTPTSTARPTVNPAPAPVAETPVAETPWTNPVAAAALRSTVQLLADVENGVVRNFSDSSVVRGYANDLASAVGTIDAATIAITNDASKENDSFLPLIGNAGDSATHAENRLEAKELESTWTLERSGILAAIRRARTISQNVADQLDPRVSPKS
jgi:hypothetical protein